MSTGARAAGRVRDRPLRVTQSSSVGRDLRTSEGAGARGDRAVAADAAIAEDEHAFGELCDVVLMSDEYDGESLIVQVLQNLHNFDGSAAVEIPGGLVGQENRRAID